LPRAAGRVTAAKDAAGQVCTPTASGYHQLAAGGNTPKSNFFAVFLFALNCQTNRHFLNTPMSQMTPSASEMIAVLQDGATDADGTLAWPESSWQAMGRGGVVRWAIPAAYGGDGWDIVRLLDGYERVAAACMTSCFILSQRDAACRRLVSSANQELARELLPALAEGKTFATVGLSQLTTS